MRLRQFGCRAHGRGCDGGFVEGEVQGLVLAASDANQALQHAAVRRFHGNRALAFAHGHGRRERCRAHLLAVDEHGGVAHVDVDGHRGNALFEIGEILRDLRQAIAFDLRPALFHVALHGVARLDVLAQLKVGLANVVQHFVVRLHLVGALELHQSRVEIPIFVELRGLREMLTGLIDVVRAVSAGRSSAGGGGARLGVRGQRREHESQRLGASEGAQGHGGSGHLA